MFIVHRRGNRSMNRTQLDLDDVFHSLVGGGRPIGGRTPDGTVPVWRPPVEVYETDREFVILAELAGLREDEIEVLIDDNVITIRGRRNAPECADRRTIHAMGILYGPFGVDVYLPTTIDADAIEATYQDGMLEIRLAKAAATRIAVGTKQPAQGTESD